MNFSKFKYLYLVVLSFVFACQSSQNKNITVWNHSGHTEDTLVYQTDTSIQIFVHQNDTTLAKIDYLNFTQKNINQLFIDSLCKDFEGHPLKNWDDKTENFIKNYQAQLKDMDTHSAAPQYLLERMKCEVNTSEWLSVSFESSSYTGGAHGNTYTTYMNFNPKTLKMYDLRKMTDTLSYQKLTQLAKRIFMQNEKITTDKEIKDNYFFEHGIFALSEQFTLTKDGVLFWYNTYDIKAYVFGPTKLEIPFQKILEILPENDIICETIKKLQ